ncbi:MAG TPA: ParB/RepB/Spo0J family partition protein [Vicinamibacterales bacterium]|nr:ParB/RepB/Spo0J family partition protein [Vicinamibacterales bacterium]
MTTAALESPPAAPAADQFRILARASIQPSPLNPRKTFDEDKLCELANSIKEVGIIEPLIVRPKERGLFELVAGERRWRAAQLAGISEVPAIVKDLTDAQVLEMMVVENNQREDVNPLEEADGFRRILGSGVYDVDRLAERIGRSRKYVYDRIKLLDLVPDAQALLLEGKLTAGHAILLARLKPEDQARAIDPGEEAAFEFDAGVSEEDEAIAFDAQEDERSSYVALKARSVRELQAWIGRHVRFDVAQAATAAPHEFGDLVDRVAEASAKPGRGKKVISITFDHHVHDDAKDENERTYGPQSWRWADGLEHPVDSWSARSKVFPTCEHSVLGIVVAGSRQWGRAFQVCVARDKCEVHFGDEIKAREKAQRDREREEERRAKKGEPPLKADQKAQQSVAARAEADRKKQEAEERRRERIETLAMDRALERVKEVTPEILRLALANIVSGDVDHDGFSKRFGVKVSYQCAPSMFKPLSGAQLARALAFAVISAEGMYGDLKGVLSAFGVDLKKVEAEVLAEEKAAEQKSAAPAKSSAKPGKAPAKKPVAKAGKKAKKR